MDAEDLLLRHVLGILRAGRHRPGGPVDPLPAARRRHLGDVRRRARRPVHHGRGLGRAAAGRRPGRGPAHARARPGSPGRRGGVAATRVFTRIWLSLVGLWSWDDVPTIPPEIVLLPRVGAAEHLRLGLLGPADDRAARGRVEPAAGVPGAVRHRRARRRPAPAHRPAVRLGPRVRRAGQGAQGVRAAPGRARCARTRYARPSAGSSTGRRPTGPGAASSRRGSTR